MANNDFNSDDEQPKMKIVFAPGCFDDFDGTQEELDELVAQLTEMAESGELLENSSSVDDLEEIDDEVLELLPMLTSGNVRH
jgi:hypothetical protein